MQLMVELGVLLVHVGARGAANSGARGAASACWR